MTTSDGYQPHEPQLQLHATCDDGLEDLLAAELEQLGGEITNRTRRGVSFQGSREVMWRVNMCSRLASRVLEKVADFRASGERQLYTKVAQLDWPAWMDVDDTLAVDTTGRSARLTDPRYVAQVTKDAICDHFREVTGRRPSVDRQRPHLRINIHLSGPNAVVSLDTSGERLHRRGYRKEAGIAPLRETLAAGLLAHAGWVGDRPLTDPLCGSGTVPIEAALIARNIAPGLVRLRRRVGFGFQRRPDHDAEGFERLVAELEAAVLPEPPVALRGSDINPRMVGLARANAGRAGVASDISWSAAPLVPSSSAGQGGVLVTNPPYGERMGSPAALEALYRALGDKMKQSFKGGEAWILCGEPALAKKIGLRAKRRIPIFNGPIECRLLGFELWDGSRKGR